MIHMLSQLFNTSAATAGTVAFAGFLLIALYTLMVLSRHLARKAQSHPELCLVADDQ